MTRVTRICATAVLAAITFGWYQSAFAECGIASTYSHGSVTANGERYNHNGISAAHKSLPFGTRVVVTHQRTGRHIVVRINDRGPYVGGRIIDLSTGAMRALGMGGLAPVCIQVAGYGEGVHAHRRRHEDRQVVYRSHRRYYAHSHHRYYAHSHHRSRHHYARDAGRFFQNES